MEPLGVHHVALNVANSAESVAFYVDVLGLTLRTDRPDIGINGAWLDAGDQQVHLIELPTPSKAGQHFALRVASIHTTIAELRARGIQVSDASPIGSSLQAFLADPSGNEIELHEINAG